MDLLTHLVLALGIAVSMVGYIFTVRKYRYQRSKAIQSRFDNRPLSSMTVQEAHQILRELRQLEFPYTMHSAMKLSLLKVPATIQLARIPTCKRY